MHDGQGSGIERLRESIERKLENGKFPSVAELERLVRLSEPGSDAHVFAHTFLAEAWLECDPWRAALSLKVVLRARPYDDLAWGRLGLAMTLMGNYRTAESAYRRALSVCPGDPWYSHNLGHLLDVMLDHPEEAIPLLRTAHEALPEDAEIASSLAHALARTGSLQEARDLLQPFMAGLAYREHRLLYRWILAEIEAKEQTGPDSVSASSGGRS